MVAAIKPIKSKTMLMAAKFLCPIPPQSGHNDYSHK